MDRGAWWALCPWGAEEADATEQLANYRATRSAEQLSRKSGVPYCFPQSPPSVTFAPPLPTPHPHCWGTLLPLMSQD